MPGGKFQRNAGEGTSKRLVVLRGRLALLAHVWVGKIFISALRISMAERYLPGIRECPIQDL